MPKVGRPLKSGEPRKDWHGRLPVSTIQAIKRLAKLYESQTEVVIEAVRQLDSK